MVKGRGLGPRLSISIYRVIVMLEGVLASSPFIATTVTVVVPTFTGKV
jgi:hypothetical protein